MVATSDAHYLTQDDYLAHDVLLCINTGKTLDQPLDKPRFVADDGKLSNQFHVRSPEEMYSFLPGMDETLAISARIAEGIEENYSSLGLGKRQFPSFQAPEEKSAEEYLQELCERGLRERYGDPPPPSAQERLDHELGVIQRMGFASYFLIVWDFVRYARERGIPASRAGRHAAPWSATSCTSAMSARSSTTCCSSGFSTPIAPRRPTSTSTSARSGATR